MEQLKSGDFIKLRKKHPCGCGVWLVKNMGAEVKLECAGCKRIVIMDNNSLKKMLKGKITAVRSTEFGYKRI